MDYWAALNELYREREHLTTVIRNLETLVGGKQPKAFSRRGRKNMSASEREEVSARMKRYWASRRGQAES